MLNYPLTYNSMRFNGPTLIYIDQDGNPVQLELTTEQAEAIIRDWNVGAIDESEIGEQAQQLKPPRAA